MYLILHKYINHETKITDKAIHYKLIAAWDTKSALVEFYKHNEYFGIDETMFSTIIDKIDLKSAVALHNALRPNRTIVAIYEVTNEAKYISDYAKDIQAISSDENDDVHELS